MRALHRASRRAKRGRIARLARGRREEPRGPEGAGRGSVARRRTASRAGGSAEPWLAAALALVIAACGGAAAHQPARTRTGTAPAIQRGLATFYGKEQQGGPTASGERFDRHQLTAAHRTLPLGTRVRVTNTQERTLGGGADQRSRTLRRPRPHHRSVRGRGPEARHDRRRRGAGDGRGAAAGGGRDDGADRARRADQALRRDHRARPRRPRRSTARSSACSAPTARASRRCSSACSASLPYEGRRRVLGPRGRVATAPRSATGSATCRSRRRSCPACARSSCAPTPASCPACRAPRRCSARTPRCTTPGWRRSATSRSTATRPA